MAEFQALHRAATQQRHEEQLKGWGPHVKTLLVGDSVFERFIWGLDPELKFPPEVLVLAKGGDRIEHLLWRLDHTPDAQHITRVILHIGTNNSPLPKKKEIADHTKRVASGILEVVRRMERKFPQARVEWLPLYPRKDVSVEIIDQINREVAFQLADNPEGRSQVLSAHFWDDLLPRGFCDQQYEDHVHLNHDTYVLFFEKLMTHLRSKGKDPPTQDQSQQQLVRVVEMHREEDKSQK